MGRTIGNIISDRLLIVISARRQYLTQSLKDVSKRAISSAAQVARNSSRSDEATATANTAAMFAESQVTSLLDDQDWVTPVARGLGNCVGWMLSYYFQSWVHAMSACSLGSEIVVTAIQDIADPILSQFQLPSTRSPEFSAHVTTVQTVLTGLALSRAIVSGRELPGGLLGTILLFPLTMVESTISTAFFILGVTTQF